MLADNGCGLPIVHQVGEVLFSGPVHESNQRDVARSDSGCVFFSQHAMPEVVLNVITPPTPLAPLKKSRQ